MRALARTIIPTDEASPGAEDACVVEGLGRMVAGSRERQSIYEPGLLAFDELAFREHGRSFVGLTEAERSALLRYVDELRLRTADNRSMLTKIWSRIRRLYLEWDGSLAAVDLFPVLVQDVMRVFYTHPISWVWLGYDGPPMPHGYPGGIERSSDVQRSEYERVGLWA